MKNSILTVLLSLAVSFVHAQTCSGNFIFELQSDVDQFLIDNPTCTSIQGGVVINIADNVDPILNVAGLQNITEIHGLLQIQSGYDAAIPPLLGLSNLITADSILINSSSSTMALDGLDNLQNVSSLYINAYYIDDLHAFDNITNLDDLTIDFMWEAAAGTPPSFYDVFPNLQSVSNQLIIGKLMSECGTLTGFNSLLSVGELSFSFWDLLVMDTFDGMHNLQTIDSIFYNYAWSANSVSGFENLVSIGGFAEMALQCPCDMPDFESLNSIGSLWLFNFVTSLPDFPSLITVPGEILILGDAQSIGFVSLQEVTGDISISPDASGTFYYFDEIHMDSLQHVGGTLSIVATDIDNVDFLSNLEYVGETFELYGNFNLSNCEAEYLCQQIPISPVMFHIELNAPGCNSNEEVVATCSDSYALGEVYYDLDCDGVYNNADVMLQNPVLFDDLNQPVGSSNYDGEFFVSFPDNTTTTIAVGDLPGYSTTPQTFTTTGTAQVFSNIQFAMCPQANLHDVSVSLYTPQQIRPNYYTGYYFTVHNNAPTAEHVVATFTLTDMPGMTYGNSNPQGTISGNTVSWDFPSVPGLGEAFFSITLLPDINMPIGSMVTSDIQVDVFPNQTDDIFLGDNHLSYTQTVVNSFDPNDITVNIPAYNHDLIAPQSALSLDYTIRFQNTGTAEAINVRVLDDIEEDLDLSSFEMIGSSHPCTLTFNENNQVEWLFENIMLPDSTSDEEASHGYIQYRIETQPNLMLEDVVENTAAIYFDFNEPVITNTATTVFYLCPATPEPMADQTICEGEVVAYSGPLGWDDYAWTTIEGEISTTNQVQIMSLPAGTLNIAFDASTEYCQYQDEVNVIILGTPTAPVITQIGNTLTATGGGVFIWTFNGDVLSASGNSIEIQESGIYSVAVVVNSCSSTITNGNFTTIGVEESKEPNFILSPNPMFNQAQMKIQNGLGLEIYMSISDPMGKNVRSQKVTTDLVRINRDDMASGVYYVSLFNSQGVVFKTQKLLVE